MKPPALALFALALLPLFEASAEGAESSFLPENYGAMASDNTDDRAAIQAALDDAAAAGGGTVQLGPGVYDVQVIVAYGLGPVNGFNGGASGFHGLLVPPKCTLTGSGMENTTVRILAGNANPLAIGDGIINAGYQTALSDFGGGGNYRISHLRVDTPDINVAPTGNLIGMAHADGVTLTSVALGASRYHAVEINLSRNVVLEDCVFEGEHSEASTLQFDIGSIGAKSARPRGTVVSDVMVRRCQFRGRGAEQYGKVIELGHTGSAGILRNIAFEDCYIESMGGPYSACVTNDNPPAQEFTGLRFERCRFHGLQEAYSPSGLLQFLLQGTQTLDGLTVRDCHFTGSYWNGLIVISTSATFNTGHSKRRNILIEGNTFTPSLNRTAPTSSGGSIRMASVTTCAEVTLRRNLFEVPDTAVNLNLTGVVTGILAANNLDTKIEDNVFTWAHLTEAAAPLGKARHIGISAPLSILEQSAMKARMQMTGNVFLYPANGIAGPVSMSTSVPTTSWAAGGPWVGGLMAGNFASGAGRGFVWSVHHDLSGVANIGQILPAGPSRPAGDGWYACNGTALATLDVGMNSLARVNAGKCGYESTLPELPGKVIRLHGPLTGEGLVAPEMARFAGAVYRGTVEGVTDLGAIPFASLTQGDLRVVRSPLAVFRWDSLITPDAAPPGSCAPTDKPADNAGCWIMFRSCAEFLADDADLDKDGLSNLQERAFLGDPSAPDPPDMFETTASPGGLTGFRFYCNAGATSPRMCLQSSDDLASWRVESSCAPGGPFEPPASGTLTESSWKTGRIVTVELPPGTRRFWRLVVEP